MENRPQPQLLAILCSWQATHKAASGHSKQSMCHRHHTSKPLDCNDCKRSAILIQAPPQSTKPSLCTTCEECQLFQTSQALLPPQGWQDRPLVGREQSLLHL